MSTSIHNGIVSFDATLYGLQDSPESAVIARDGVANGILHCADSVGQCRVNYNPAQVDPNKGKGYADLIGLTTASQFYQFEACPFGPWPLTLHADGSGYVLRIRLGAASSSSTSATLRFRVVIAPLILAQARALNPSDQPVDYVWEANFNASVSGTTAAYRTGASAGSGAYVKYAYIDAATAASWRSNQSVYNAVAGATPMTVQQVLVGAYVSASTTNASVEPRLHGLHISEYVGTIYS